MNSNTELFFKIITITGTFLLAYHKYILYKSECEKERLYTEKFRIENIKTLNEGIKKIEERMTRIEKQLKELYKN